MSCNAAAWLSLPAVAVGIMGEAFATNTCAGALQDSMFWETPVAPQAWPGESLKLALSAVRACLRPWPWVCLLGWLAGCLSSNGLF